MLLFGQYNTLLVYNTHTNDWIMGKLPLDSGIMFKSYCSAVRLDSGSVLLIGGGYSNEIYEFSPNSLKVSLRAQMERTRTEHASVLVGGKVYILGGFEKHGNQFLAECEVFDPVTNRLTLIAPMKTPKCGFSCVSTDT